MAEFLATSEYFRHLRWACVSSPPPGVWTRELEDQFDKTIGKLQKLKKQKYTICAIKKVHQNCGNVMDILNMHAALVFQLGQQDASDTYIQLEFTQGGFYLIGPVDSEAELNPLTQPLDIAVAGIAGLTAEMQGASPETLLAIAALGAAPRASRCCAKMWEHFEDVDLKFEQLMEVLHEHSDTPFDIETWNCNHVAIELHRKITSGLCSSECTEPVDSTRTLHSSRMWTAKMLIWYFPRRMHGKMAAVILSADEDGYLVHLLGQSQQRWVTHADASERFSIRTGASERLSIHDSQTSLSIGSLVWYQPRSMPGNLMEGVIRSVNEDGYVVDLVGQVDLDGQGLRRHVPSQHAAERLSLRST